MDYKKQNSTIGQPCPVALKTTCLYLSANFGFTGLQRVQFFYNSPVKLAQVTSTDQVIEDEYRSKEKNLTMDINIRPSSR